MDNSIAYGLWEPGRGFVRSNDGKVVAFTEKKIALEVASLYGRNIKVRFVDNSIVSLEKYLLENESKTFFGAMRKLWRS